MFISSEGRMPLEFLFPIAIPSGNLLDDDALKDDDLSREGILTFCDDELKDDDLFIFREGFITCENDTDFMVGCEVDVKSRKVKNKTYNFLAFLYRK
jgi:hypothetical protein